MNSRVEGLVHSDKHTQNSGQNSNNDIFLSNLLEAALNLTSYVRSIVIPRGDSHGQTNDVRIKLTFVQMDITL